MITLKGFPYYNVSKLVGLPEAESPECFKRGGNGLARAVGSGSAKMSSRQLSLLRSQQASLHGSRVRSTRYCVSRCLPEPQSRALDESGPLTTALFASPSQRVKRRYLQFLRDVKGRDETSLDAVAKAIERFDEYNRRRDFKKFHIEQARAFKAHLMEQRNVRTGALCQHQRSLRPSEC
jgi:hypothetical protein